MDYICTIVLHIISMKEPAKKKDKSRQYGLDSHKAAEPKPTGVHRGVPKGRVSKEKLDLRLAVKKFAEDNFETFQDAFNALDKRDQVDAYIKVCKFVLPTIQHVAFENMADSQSMSHRDRLRELAYGKKVEDASFEEVKPAVPDDGFKKEDYMK